MLIEALIDQNKAYGRKIISLYETLDSVYKSNTPQEASPGLGSPDFNAKLHQKILDYEDLVKKLTSENEGFSSQIKQLSQQIESLKTQSYGNHSNNSGKKSVTIVTSSPSPLTKSGGGGNSNASKEVSQELEHLFSHAEYKKAVELLGQIDYKKPFNVASEKFNSWLIIANRMKDTSFNDVLNKLKILLTFADRGEDDDEPVTGLDDSLDHPTSTVAEKIYCLLDERIPKVILRNEYKLETKKQQEKAHEDTSMMPSNKGDDEDSMLTKEQLQMKVHYLNAKVEQMERTAQDKSFNSTLKSPVGKYQQSDDIYQELQQEIDKRLNLENQTREVVDAYEDLKEKYDGLLRDVSEYDAKCQELSEQLKDNGDFIERLMQENVGLKEQVEFSEKLEDMEKIQELIQEKDLKIKSLTDEINLIKDSTKSPQKTLYSDIKKILNDTPSAQKETSDLRNQISLEIALQAQATALETIQQTFANLSLTEILAHFKLDLPSRKNSLDINDGLDHPSSEAQRILKENNNLLRQISRESEFIKNIITKIQTHMLKSENLQNPPPEFTKRVVQAEEKLFENLSSSIQIVSQLTSLLSGTSESNQISSQMPQIHQVLQNLHMNLATTIQEYPDFSQEIGGPQSPFKDLKGKSQQLSTSFKDKLVQDQSDLKTKLKSTLQNLESYQTSEIYQKLYQEIDRNVELQEMIDSRDAAIHRLNLIFAEGIERSVRSLEQLAKLADSEEAQGLLAAVLGEISVIKKKLKEIVDTNKTGGLKLDEALVKAEGEYDLQRNIWLDTIKDLEDENERRIRQLIREIEGEREAHEHTRNKLMRVQEDVMSADKVTRMTDEFRREIHGLNEKLREKEFEVEKREREYENLRKDMRTFEKERGGISNQVERLKEELNHIGLERSRLREDLACSGEEKQEIRKNLEEIIREVDVLRRNTAQKNGEIEDLVSENEKLRKDLHMFKNDFEDLENGFEKARNENRHLLEETNEGLEKKQREIDSLRRKINDLERENEDLAQHRIASEAKLKESVQHADHLKLNYFNDITAVKEENRSLSSQKRQYNLDLEKKNQEIAKLNQMMDSLQEFSNKQLETIREREEKIHVLSTQKREIEQFAREAERRVEEVTEKNKKYSESINQNSSDVQILKAELHELMDKHAALQRDLLISRQKNEELSHHNQELTSSREVFSSGKSVLEDKVRKMNEINQITKNELKNCRDLLEERNRELAHKDQEIKDLRELPRRDRDAPANADLVSYYIFEN